MLHPKGVNATDMSICRQVMSWSVGMYDVSKVSQCFRSLPGDLPEIYVVGEETCRHRHRGQEVSTKYKVSTKFQHPVSQVICSCYYRGIVWKILWNPVFLTSDQTVIQSSLQLVRGEREISISRSRKVYQKAFTAYIQLGYQVRKRANTCAGWIKLGQRVGNPLFSWWIYVFHGHECWYKAECCKAFLPFSMCLMNSIRIWHEIRHPVGPAHQRHASSTCFFEDFNCPERTCFGAGRIQICTCKSSSRRDLCILFMAI